MQDLLVIGGGPGGFAAALHAARGGKTVTLFEGGEIGGTCLNRGCIPTKTLLHGAGPDCDLAALKTEKERVVSTLRTGMEGALRTAKVTVVPHRAVVTGAHTVAAGGERYEGAAILIATGSAPARPPIPGLDLPGVLTSDALLEEVPSAASMVIIGGGVVGVELACVYAAIGCRVTVLEGLERILANLDRELSQSIAMQMKKDGVELVTSATVEQIAPGFSVTYTCKGERKTATAERVLVATGRRPETADLFSGVSPAMERGFLTVDDRFCTSVPSLYAIGDAIGGAMLAHKAEAEGRYVADLLLGKTPGRGVAPIPACVYTSPELAQVGLGADDCKERGIPCVAGKCVMGGNGRTLIEGGRRGFMKLLFHRDTHVLLGAQLCCYRATDLISELTLAVTLGLTARQLLLPVRPHPTFAEAIGEAVENALAALERES